MRNSMLQLSLMSLVLSACAGIVGPSAQEMTLQARNDDLSEQINALRQTATVEMDRMMVTVEHASTEVRSVAFQRDALRATLIARGTDAGFIDVTGPQAGDELPAGIDSASLLPTPGTGGAAPPVTPPGAGGNGVLNPNQIAAETTPTATPPTQAGPRLVDPVLATGVASNDCAADSVTSFASTAPEIYIVATAQDFPPGTTVTARWAREGTVQGSYDIPFDFAIEDACIWAFIDQTDFAFAPGAWTVELLVNQAPSLGPIPFTITGDAPVEDTMADEGQ